MTSGVVLDYEDGVAKVAEVLHDANELGGVAGMEAECWVRPGRRGRLRDVSLAMWLAGCVGTRRRRGWRRGGRG